MSRWVRLWDDMPTDPKWRVIARRSGRPITEVISVFVFMMTAADPATGALDAWDDEDVSAALDIDVEAVTAIRRAMEGKTIEDGRLSGWEKRQPKRQDDSSTDRVRAFRERKRADETHVKRDETHGNAPDKKREETDTEKEGRRAQAREILIPLKRVFPEDGSVIYTDWVADIIRKHQPGRDLDLVASQFRRWCHEKDIDFADPHIEKVLTTFCQKHRIAA